MTDRTRPGSVKAPLLSALTRAADQRWVRLLIPPAVRRWLSVALDRAVINSDDPDAYEWIVR